MSKKIRGDIVENRDAQNEDYGPLSDEIKKSLTWFRDQKIGVIFHWGLYAQAGIVESWQLSKEDDWARKKPWRENLQQLREDYWALADEFNPENFNPDDWAKICKDAGFKYMLFTTKHHDGFNMFDTQESEFKVTNSPVHQDLFKAINSSFQKLGVATGAYYSKADWYSPYYWEPNSDPIGRFASYDPAENPELWEKYNEFVKRQLLEICTYYGKQRILWLDGGWVNSEHHEILNMPDIVSAIRKLQPEILIVDRTIGGEYEDYVTPERKIPDVSPKKAWESNIPLAKNWGYVPNDIYKSFEEILGSVIKVVALGGNVILGIGPKQDGTLPEEAVKLISTLGKWLAIYGEGIYETRPTDLLSQTGWYFTKRGKHIYAFGALKEGAESLEVSSIINLVKQVTDMKTGEAVAIASRLEVNAEKDEPYIVLNIQLAD